MISPQARISRYDYLFYSSYHHRANDWKTKYAY